MTDQLCYMSIVKFSIWAHVTDKHDVRRPQRAHKLIKLTQASEIMNQLCDTSGACNRSGPGEQQRGDQGGQGAGVVVDGPLERLRAGWGGQGKGETHGNQPSPGKVQERGNWAHRNKNLPERPDLQLFFFFRETQFILSPPFRCRRCCQITIIFFLFSPSASLAPGEWSTPGAGGAGRRGAEPHDVACLCIPVLFDWEDHRLAEFVPGKPQTGIRVCNTARVNENPILRSKAMTPWPCVNIDQGATMNLTIKQPLPSSTDENEKIAKALELKCGQAPSAKTWWHNFAKLDNTTFVWKKH